jgi:hypothetical protein
MLQWWATFDTCQCYIFWVHERHDSSRVFAVSAGEIAEGAMKRQRIGLPISSSSSYSYHQPQISPHLSLTVTYVSPNMFQLLEIY